MATLNDKLREIATVDLATYCAFICKLVSVDGGQRGEVEALLDAFGRHHPDAFVGRLLEVLGKGGEAESRTIAATLLRKVSGSGFVEEEGVGWGQQPKKIGYVKCVCGSYCYFYYCCLCYCLCC